MLTLDTSLSASQHKIVQNLTARLVAKYNPAISFPQALAMLKKRTHLSETPRQILAAVSLIPPNAVRRTTRVYWR